MATQMVTENSRNSRPRMPPMNSTGMNTAASDSVIDTIVNRFLRPGERRVQRLLSISMLPEDIFQHQQWRRPTTKPMERINAIIDRLSRL